MYKIIAPTLFHNKICRLPGIGTLKMVAHSAETDFANSRINAPAETIGFIPSGNDEKFFNEFSAISELLQKNLSDNGFSFLKGIGTFIKDETGTIHFAPVTIDPMFLPSVATETVVRKYASHALLVGDRKTTNVAMAEFFSVKLPLKERWMIWAIVLGAIGISLLILYFYKHGFNALGNVS